MEEVLTELLDLIEDPDVSPEDQATYMHIVGGITSTLKAIQDPDTAPEDRAAGISTVKAMSEALSPPPPSRNLIAPQGPDWFKRAMGDAGTGMETFNNSQSAPEDPKDRKEIQKKIEEICNALRTVQNPNASPNERKEALKKVKERITALSNSQYLQLMKEIKRYKPSAACVETIENRTRQVGWADGSLWGLADSSCADALAAGASQESTQWHALLVCVQRSPFSSCVDYVPEE
ncbi:hypothetical protein ABZ424_25125 [Streptomyces sp. NPDC005790]|uniref:hypothetical protein n=1 Tax=Streptomyces sp. NPDC005790 TaxID=3154777 RepID=UPI0033CDCE68